MNFCGIICCRPMMIGSPVVTVTVGGGTPPGNRVSLFFFFINHIHHFTMFFMDSVTVQKQNSIYI